jgi:hypothetical protein
LHEQQILADLCPILSAAPAPKRQRLRRLSKAGSG